MKHEMTIEYLRCRADLNFEVAFGVNSEIGRIVTKWNLILFGKWVVFNNNTNIFKIRIIWLFNNNHCLLHKTI